MTAERWQKLTLMEQLGNIGSEVSRAIRSQNKDRQLFEDAVNRALGLLDLTLDDPRWKNRQCEIARVREIFCDIIFGNNRFKTSLTDLLQYFNQFAYAARLHLF